MWLKIGNWWTRWNGFAMSIGLARWRARNRYGLQKYNYFLNISYLSCIFLHFFAISFPKTADFLFQVDCWEVEDLSRVGVGWAEIQNGKISRLPLMLNERKIGVDCWRKPAENSQKVLI